MRRICIFIGPPGAGKGSLSSLCVKKLGFFQLSTGNLCRMHISQKTDIGERIDFAIKSGKLVDNSLIFEMVSKWLSENDQKAHEIIFDGFPRTLAQAKAMYQFFKDSYSNKVKLSIIHLEVSKNELVRRVLARLVCGNNNCQAVFSRDNFTGREESPLKICTDCNSTLVQRTDDTEEAMKTRLDEYFEHEQGIINFFESVGLMPYKLRSERSLDVVFSELVSVLS